MEVRGNFWGHSQLIEVFSKDLAIYWWMWQSTVVGGPYICISNVLSMSSWRRTYVVKTFFRWTYFKIIIVVWGLYAMWFGRRNFAVTLFSVNISSQSSAPNFFYLHKGASPINHKINITVNYSKLGEGGVVIEFTVILILWI